MQTKAKAIRKYVDKMIGLAKEGTLHARRQALAFVYDEDLVKSLFEQVGAGVGVGACGCGGGGGGGPPAGALELAGDAGWACCRATPRMPRWRRHAPGAALWKPARP